MDVQGSIGWPIVGDKTFEFYRDPIKFLNSNIDKTKSKVFATRFLNRATVFVCSNVGVREVLNDASNSFSLGYAAFLKSLFGDNILFFDNDIGVEVKTELSTLFTPDCVHSFEAILEEILKKKLPLLENEGNPVCVYSFFKEMFTEFFLTLFLGLDFDHDKELAQSVLGLQHDHWQGLAAVPLSVPGSKNNFSKSMKAKKTLLEVIKTQRIKATSGFPYKMQQLLNSAFDETSVQNHMLLFTSALIPKTFASICSSFCLEMSTPEQSELQQQVRQSPEVQEQVLLEILRLFPPLMGGRRIARKHCVIDGYHVPKDYAVVFITQAAHRDPSAFPDPDILKPERWADRCAQMNKLFTFGMGPRKCLGREMSMNMIRTTLTQVMSKYSIKITENQNKDHKYIPVSRPKEKCYAIFTPVETALFSMFIHILFL